VGESLIIETSGLRKTFGEIEALRGLDLQVPAGSICGFLGRNGAGKTTTIKVLLGLIRATGGEARVFGLPAGEERASVEIRRRAALVSEAEDLYGAMTVEQMIRFTASFFPGWRSDLQARLLRRFDLRSGTTIKRLSQGMRTRLALLLALCRGAELLVLDEPTSGLDPAAAEEVLQALVTYIAEEPKTIFLCSHQIAEIEQIADRVAIIDHGRLVLSGSLDALQRSFRRISMVFDRDAPAVEFRGAGVARVRREGRALTVFSNDGGDAVLDQARALHPVSVEVAPVGLKEIFFETIAAED